MRARSLGHREAEISPWLMLGAGFVRVPSDVLFRFFFVFCKGGSELDCFQRLTLGTTCILAAGCYVDDTQPREERGTKADSVLVRVVIRIVRTLREKCSGRKTEDAGMSETVAGAGRGQRLSPAGPTFCLAGHWWSPAVEGAPGKG